MQDLIKLGWHYTPTYEHQVILTKDKVNIILNKLSLKLFIGTENHSTLEYTLEELRCIKLPTWENTSRHSKTLKLRLKWLIKYVSVKDVKLFIEILEGNDDKRAMAI